LVCTFETGLIDAEFDGLSDEKVKTSKKEGYGGVKSPKTDFQTSFWTFSGRNRGSRKK